MPWLNKSTTTAIARIIGQLTVTQRWYALRQQALAGIDNA